MVVSALSAVGLTTTLTVNADFKQGEITLNAPDGINYKQTFSITGNLHYRDGRTWPKPQAVLIDIVNEARDKKYGALVWIDEGGNFQATINPEKITFWQGGQDVVILAYVYDTYGPDDAFTHPTAALLELAEHIAWSNAEVVHMKGTSQLNLIQDQKIDCITEDNNLHFYGVLIDQDKNPIQNGAIQLGEVLSGGKINVVATTTTNEKGQYEFHYPAVVHTWLQAKFDENPDYTSSEARLQVELFMHKTALTLISNNYSPMHGKQYIISGDLIDKSTSIGIPNAEITLKYFDSTSNSWQAKLTIHTDANGHFTKNMNVPLGTLSPEDRYIVTYQDTVDGSHNCGAQSPEIRIVYT
jgi:hypothetical protein